MKSKRLIFFLIAIILLAFAMHGCTVQEPVVTQTPVTEAPEIEQTPEPDQASESEHELVNGYYILHGELLDVTTDGGEDGNVLVVKVKIEPSFSNKATVDQNYYNVEHLIKKQDATSYSSIQYWAVADMADGSEQKVVSFKVDSDLIQKIADDSVPANQYGGYVTDLFVHQSLK